MPVPDSLPSFDELPAVDGAPPQSGWWLFGKDDQVGLFNLQTPERVAEAAKLVKKGSLFPLNWKLEEPNPPLYFRGALRHTITGKGPGRDDLYDNFYPQSSSQWDGLAHVGHPVHGFYNGVKEEEISGKEGARGGIENWARRGIAGRGVLLDVQRYMESRGTPMDGGTDYRITVEELEATMAHQKVEIQTGDVLIVRTGWMAWYEQQDEMKRMQMRLPTNLKTPGLKAGEEMARWLWNKHVVSTASDCPAVESWPPTPETGGFLHQYLIGLFGMALGEMWYLEKLADDCAADGVYEFFFTAAPLNKLGGIGSPPNAMAIK